MNRVDTAIRVAAGVTVAGLAGIAGAISYSHMTELAHAHGETDWRAHMFPLSVDGIEIVASLVLLADKRAGRRSGRLPWAALIAGTGASFAANIAVGGSDWIGRAVSGWPAFALLVAVKLLFGLLEHPTARATGEAPAGPVPSITPDDTEAAGTVPGTGDRADIAPGAGQDDGDEPATVPTVADEPWGGGDEASSPESADTSPTEDQTPVVSTALDVSALMSAARMARQALVSAGKPLTREGLARQMRADGHAASNARVSALLRALQAEGADFENGSLVA